jgi:hypothetical protein
LMLATNWVERRNWIWWSKLRMALRIYIISISVRFLYDKTSFILWSLYYF